ncbi:CoA pyrophosphatase [Flavobacterium sp. DG1-102-2]|uniref:NUDIX hydrolase n=1 Tax=Flavobacterium sp. DG1-102-2 TaxID=3081663 RepID=UPI002948DB66|nr:CoA pyrophosphatase [Flavobacterium sp. DG1-102-2]MDV6170393.1 CoA pyrophosphatase [Flavobacterium sp. DG1-102-2]
MVNKINAKMLFTEFIQYVPKIVNQQLPALSAHLKMAPASRIPTLAPDYYKDNNPKRSAVMMLFYPKDGMAHLVLIKRNAYEGVHSSQISFPGGKAEPEDTNLAATAVRETFEEVGVIPTDIDVVMPFTEIYIPPSNFLVAPFLGLSMTEPQFMANPDEVVEIIPLSLDVFLDDSIVIETEMQTTLGKMTGVPAFKVGEHVVWGATAMILSELKETIKSVL